VRQCFAWSTDFSNGPCVCFLVREMKEVKVTTGTVKKVISDRGFGFITADDGKEYFFHRNALQASLDFDRMSGGEKVDFDIEQSPKGPRANNVRAAETVAS
jgi:cold shock protein